MLGRVDNLKICLITLYYPPLTPFSFVPCVLISVSVAKLINYVCEAMVDFTWLICDKNTVLFRFSMYLVSFIGPVLRNFSLLYSFSVTNLYINV